MTKRWIQCGHAVIGHSPFVLHADCVLVVENGVIQEVLKTSTVQRNPDQDWVDWSHCLVIPGFVNVHTHTTLVMVRGEAEDMGFAPAYTAGVPHGHDVSEDEAIALSRLGAYECLRFGSTTINDSYVHAHAVMPAMAELGMRVVGSSRIHDVDFSLVHLRQCHYDRAIGHQTMDQAVRLIEQVRQDPSGRLGVTINPHAPDTCSKDLLQGVACLQAETGYPVCTHLSQSEAENKTVLARDGMTPAELLDATGLLSDRLIAAHGMYLTDADLARIGRARIHLAHVPKGNATGGRIAPTRAMEAAGVQLALATDNMHGDMIEAMRWALNMGRIQAGCIDSLWNAWRVLEMATIAGARALQMDHRVGSLEVGKQADIVAIDLRVPNLQPAIQPIGALVHCGLGRDVSHVLVDGIDVVRDGELVCADASRILQDGRVAADALWARARNQM